MCIILLTILVLIGLLVLGELLILQQYKQHRNVWERDGRPIGFFIRPTKAGLMQGTRAKNRILVIWLFTTPNWVRNDPYARSIHVAYRILGLIWVSVPLFFLIYGIIQS